MLHNIFCGFSAYLIDGLVLHLVIIKKTSFSNMIRQEIVKTLEKSHLWPDFCLTSGCWLKFFTRGEALRYHRDYQNVAASLRGMQSIFLFCRTGKMKHFSKVSDS